METLSFDALERLNYPGYLLKDAPEKVLQFGEGNFLRAFVDRFFDIANERAGFNGKVVMVQPIDGSYAFADKINDQDCLYTVYLRGNEGSREVDESRVISACSRCLNPYRPDDYRALMDVVVSDALEIVVSNTTEAGIAYDPSCGPDDEPPASFPAKLAQVLHARWEAKKPGVIVLSCELIDNNGAELLKIVERHAADWGWDEAFVRWLEEECTFCTTLVDTIVPGRVSDPDEARALAVQRGYEDPFADVREVFEMWDIQGDASLEKRLPFSRAGLDGSVFVTPDVTPYRKRKVRILNGAHTGFVPGAWLAGFDIVRDAVNDEVVGGFMDALLVREVIPTLSGDLDRCDLERFAAAVRDRFSNPFIDHRLLSICLNSTAKWRARDLPTLLAYVEQEGSVPPCLAASLAALIAFYTTGIQGPQASLDEEGLHLVRSDGDAYVAQDDSDVLRFYWDRRGASDGALVADVLANEAFWGQDLTEVAGLEGAVADALALIRTKGVPAAFARAQAQGEA